MRLRQFIYGMEFSDMPDDARDKEISLPWNELNKKKQNEKNNRQIIKGTNCQCGFKNRQTDPYHK